MEQEPHSGAFTCPFFSTEADIVSESIVFLSPCSLCWESVKSRGFSFVTLECKSYHLWVSKGISNPRIQQYVHIHSPAQTTVSDTLLAHFCWMNVGIGPGLLTSCHHPCALQCQDWENYWRSSVRGYLSLTGESSASTVLNQFVERKGCSLDMDLHQAHTEILRDAQTEIFIN